MDTKTGVKGLVDVGVTKIPRIFIDDKIQLNDISRTSSVASLFSVPIIDLEGVDEEGSAQRAGIINKVRDACEKFGFFQVVNHGIAEYVMDDMIDGVLRFYEQDTEVLYRVKYLSSDSARGVVPSLPKVEEVGGEREGERQRMERLRDRVRSRDGDRIGRE
ncbi:hypothetical protein RHMOL_Rhmol04G0303000 [Rhododendron molle]|uniref:Uncharacterized protein n=1 Tax=Rhododendron molle TaxID=49168 RepID=A0ACC0P5Z3_RHOML|nr:hypothetical protein RHMOL_Rhmol04G0303000 [Rhododendron molle]